MRYWRTIILATPVLAQVLEVPFRAAVTTGNPQVLRLLIGVPGASVLGEAVSAGNSLVAPGQNWAIADSGEGVEFLQLTGGLTRSPILGVSAGASVRAFSGSGKSLALYYETAGVLLVSGLPDRFQTRAVGMPAGGESLAAMAVADDGSFLIAADASGNLFQWKETWSTVAGVTGIVAVNLRDHDCLLASRGGMLLRMSTDGELSTFAQLPTIPGSQMARSSDGRRLVLVSDSAQGLIVVDLDTAKVVEVPLNRTVSSVVPARDGFLLGTEAADGAWLLGRDLQMSFLPAARR